MNDVNIKIKTDNEFLKIKYQEDRLNHKSDAGFDLYCPERIVCVGKEKTVIDLEVKLEVVAKCCDVKEVDINHLTKTKFYKETEIGYTHYLMLPRSSFSKSTLLLCNSMGVIDSQYRGSLKAVVYNYSRTNYTIEKGDRLFQLIFPIFQHIKDVKLVDELSVTDRGEGGFGSTGK